MEQVERFAGEVEKDKKNAGVFDQSAAGDQVVTSGAVFKGRGGAGDARVGVASG